MNALWTTNVRFTGIRIIAYPELRLSVNFTHHRKMKPAWVKIAGRKFPLCKYVGENGKGLPMYELSKSECLYIATKFNDEAQTKLILRWEQLETNKLMRTSSPETISLLAGQQELIETLKKELCDIKEAVSSMGKTLKAKQAEKYMRSTFISFGRYLKRNTNT
jgi:hypothetical protein